MAVLSSQDRSDTHAELMRDRGLGDTGALKLEWRQLVDAIDQYLSDNASAMNTAIPVGIRSKFTAAQKALALIYVVSKRWLRGA